MSDDTRGNILIVLFTLLLLAVMAAAIHDEWAVRDALTRYTPPNDVLAHGGGR